MGHASKRNKTVQPLLVGFFVLLSVMFGTIAAVFGGALALVMFVPIFAAIFIFIDYRVGVIILMLILPFQHTPFLPSFTGFNIVNYLTAATLCSLLFRYYFNNKPVAPFPRIFWWAYLLPILAAALHGLMYLNLVPQARIELVGLAYESPKSYLTGLILRPLFIVLVAWMVSTTVIDSKRPQLLIYALAFTMLLPAVAILAYLTIAGFDLSMLASDRSRGVLSALGLHANEFAFLLGTSFTLLLFLIPALTGRAEKLWLIFCLGIVTAALLLTFSRGGYLIAAVGFVTFALMQKRKGYLIGVGLLAAAALAIAPEALWERVTTGFGSPTEVGSSNDALTAGRVWIWQQVWPEFWKNPLIGSGVGSTAWSMPVRLGLFSYNHPHNLYLRVILDVGIVGFILFSVFIRFLLNMLRTVSIDNATPVVFAAVARGARVALIGVLIAGWSNGNYIADSELAILWMAFGLVLPFISPISMRTEENCSSHYDAPARQVMHPSKVSR